MPNLRAWWRAVCDVREGELLPTLFMSLYLLCVLFAYYILKPVSRALFLNNFRIEQLPWLYILIALIGGLLACAYTKIAVQTSLPKAVGWAMAVSIVCLVAFWWLLPDAAAAQAKGFRFRFLLYAFNIWVSMFSVVLVSQGWLVAAHIFDARQAKRLYGMLAFGAILGASLGGSFTSFAVKHVGTRNLVLASAAGLAFAYGAFRVVAARRGAALVHARAAEGCREQFELSEIPMAIGRNRHLQVIIGIMMLAFIVDVLLEFQFSAMAKQSHQGDQLTAFLGSFYGLYLGIFTMFLQFFLTGFIVTRVGVGGTLQIMPVMMTLAAGGIWLWPGLASASGARLAEAATRYSLNRTGMELLYLPLPSEIRLRTKAFVDVFVDRFARGVAGLLLALLTSVLGFSSRYVAGVTVAFAAAWILLSIRAQHEYVRTVRKRLERRRLDIEASRINVQDPAVIRLLEQAARGANPRQICYALSALEEAPRYALEPLARELASSPFPDVRAQVFQMAHACRYASLLDAAMDEIRRSDSGAARTPAMACVYTFSPDAPRLAAGLLNDPDPAVARAAIEALPLRSDLARELITHEWLEAAAAAADPHRRILATLAIAVRGDEGTGALYDLLGDPDAGVVEAACRTAGRLRNPEYIAPVARRLGEPGLRGAAIQSLAGYGTQACRALRKLLMDPSVPPAVRRQIPRVLKLTPEQPAVDALIDSVRDRDLAVRAAVLKALNRIRELRPELDYGRPVVMKQAVEEARAYFELDAALRPFRDCRVRGTACGLLARTLEERLDRTLERLFRLLGLQYPSRQIYAAWLALQRNRSEEHAAALEFLDNVLDRELKRAVLPILDSPETAAVVGHDLFGVPPRTIESALRDLIRSGDPWIASCAIAAAGERSLRALRADVAVAARYGGQDLARVASDAAVRLQ